MHGSIFVQLRHYLEDTYGPTTWAQLLKAVGVSESKVYFMLTTYSDKEAVQLIENASKITGVNRATFLDEFGRYFSKYLLEAYSIMIKPSWFTLEIIENAHTCFKHLTTKPNSGAPPKELIIERTGPYEVTICYNGKPHLCDLLIGVIHGFADHFHETITIDHEICMLEGSRECEIIIKKVPAKQILKKMRDQGSKQVT